jgi:hypothetical protein
VGQGWSSISPGSVEVIVRQLSQVIRRMTRVMSRPMVGSPSFSQTETTVALASTPQPYLGGEFVASEADHAGEGEQPKMCERARVDEALDGLAERDEGADEDREHHRETGQPLAAQAAEEEGETEWDRGERVAEVVEQVGQQRDAERARVDERLRERGDGEDAEAQGDGADAGA